MDDRSRCDDRLVAPAVAVRVRVGDFAMRSSVGGCIMTGDGDGDGHCRSESRDGGEVVGRAGIRRGRMIAHSLEERERVGARKGQDERVWRATIS